MKTFIGTKIVHATPMNRQEYNDERGWTLPATEDGADEGYLVEYTDGGAPNHTGYAGYVSWSPKAQFDAAYIDIGDVSGLPPHQQRVVAEKAELDDNRMKLNTFMDGEKFHVVCDEAERIRMIDQYNAMTTYSKVLGERIAAFKS